MRREFWINGGWARPENNFGRYEQTNVVHVREVLPGDVVLTADEAAKVREALISGSHESEVRPARKILDQAMKGDNET